MTEAESPNIRKSRPRTSSVTEGTTIRTLLVADLVDSTNFIREVGDEKAAALFSAHDTLFRTLLSKLHGREIDKTDGFLLVFRRPIEAVLYALAYQDGLADLSKEFAVPVESRVGIHLGEIVLRENTTAHIERGAKPLEVEGLAKPITARIMSVALGKQILLSETAYELAHHAAVGHAQFGNDIRWQEHDRYLFKGLDKPLRVYEVGREGYAPFAAPIDSEKAKRAQPPSRAPSNRAAPLGVVAILACILLAAVWWMRDEEHRPGKNRVQDQTHQGFREKVSRPKTIRPRKLEKTVVNYRLHFTTEPSGAEIWIDDPSNTNSRAKSFGKSIGKSPLTWETRSPSERVVVRAKKPGYQMAEKSCEVTAAEWRAGTAKCQLRLRLTKRRKTPAKPQAKPSREPRDKGLKAEPKRVRIHVID